MTKPKRRGDFSQVALQVVREATAESEGEEGSREVVDAAEQESAYPSDETDEG